MPSRPPGSARGPFICDVIPDLCLRTVPSDQLIGSTMEAIVRLCNEAYGEDVSHLFAVYRADWHVLALVDQQPVGHAMVVTRWLQAGHSPLMRAAYAELVATAPPFQGQGIGSAVMWKLAELAAAERYELAALCPAETGLYTHLCWESWQGDLFIRPPGAATREAPALIPTPEERVMILRLPGTPPLDLEQSLSAEWREGGELW